jgi:hypothetical protein
MKNITLAMDEGILDQVREMRPAAAPPLTA